MKINSLDRTVLSVASSKPMRAAVSYLMKPSKSGQLRYDKLRNHSDGIIGLWMSGFYIFNVNNNKKMDRSKKQFLNIDIATTSAIGFIGGYTISKSIKKFAKKSVDKIMKHFDKTLKSNSEKELVRSGIKGLIPMLAFTFAFRFLGPVLSTPISGTIKKKLIENGYLKAPASNQNKMYKS